MPSFDEVAFQDWYALVAANRNLDSDPDAPEHHYDYRAYYASLTDVEAEDAALEPEGTHFPSEFKADDHPDRYVLDAEGHEGILWDSKYDVPAPEEGETYEDLIRRLLNVTPLDFFLASTTLNADGFDAFWNRAYEYLRSLTDPLDTGKKRLDLERGTALLNDLRAGSPRSPNPSDALLKALDDTRTIADTLADQVRGNPVIRVGQLAFGSDVIQPTNIRVTETYDTESISTLRSEAEVTKRRPMSTTQITLDFTFAGSHINQFMRPLIAQLRAIPCLTLESAFLTNALINQYATPEIEEEIIDRVMRSDNQSLVSSIDALEGEVKDSFDNVREIMQNEDIALEFLRRRVLDRQKQLGQKPTEKVQDGSFPVSADPDTGKTVLDYGIAIPVVVTSVQLTTDQSSVNTIHLKCTFLRYNPSVFGPRGLEFRDQNGAPTVDIGKCPWIERYYKWVYLTRETNPDYFLEEYRPPVDKADFACEWDNIMDRRPESKRTFPAFGNSGKFVVEQVEAALNFAVAPIPVLGSKYPTVHVMGQSGVAAKITLATTEPSVVRAIHSMKDQVDAIARSIGGVHREEVIKIQNGVLNLLGAKEFVLTSIETEPYPNTSNGYRIKLILAQSKYGNEQQFRFEMLKGGVPVDLLRSFWGKLWEKYQEFRQSGGDGRVLDPVLSRTMELLFGPQATRTQSTIAGRDGAINTSTLIAAMSYVVNGGEAAWFLDSGTKALHNKLKDSPEYTFQNFFEFLPTAVLKGLEDQKAREAREAANLPKYEFWNEPIDIGGDNRTATEIMEAIRKQPAIQLKYAGLEDRIKAAVFQTVKNGKAQDNLSLIMPYFSEHPYASGLGIRRALWDAILEVIIRPRESPRSFHRVGGTDLWNKDFVQRALLGLSDMFASGRVGLFGDFPGLQDFINSDNRRMVARGDRKFFESNYPDLVLPTYVEMFSTRSVQLRDGTSRPLWEVFAPTFSQLGLPPPYDSGTFSDINVALSQTPKKYQDTIEPGFFYWTGTVKADMYQGLLKSLNLVGDGASLKPEDNIDPAKAQDAALERKKSTLVVDINTESSAYKGMSLKQREQTMWDRVKAVARENRLSEGFGSAQARLADKIVGGEAERKIYEVFDSQGALMGMVVPTAHGTRGEAFRIRAIEGGPARVRNFALGYAFDRRSADHTRAILEGSLTHLKDNLKSPVRHYPAFRLLFVERDDNEGHEEAAKTGVGKRVQLVDDLYTTNAVVSIHVSLSKDDAPVAIIKLLNTNGEFDNDVFVHQEQEAIPSDPNRPKVVDDEGEDFLARMRLQTGTGIVLKMGYSSNPNDLDTVFTGQIAEITPGPILKFTAQGFKSELFQKISLYQGNGNPRTAVYRVLNEFPLPHLGRKFDERFLTDIERRNLTGPTVDDNTPGLTQAFRKVFGGSLTSAARNVYFENNWDVHGTIGEWIKDVFEAVNITADRYWLFDQKTQWEALQNIAHHFPGQIVDVRPYETEATVFMGYPEQPYQYRDPSIKEQLEYQKIKKEYVVPDLRSISDGLINSFWASKHGTNPVDTKIALTAAFEYINKQGGGFTLYGLDQRTRAAAISMGAAWDNWFPAYTVLDQGARQIRDTADDLSEVIILKGLGVHDFTPDWDTVAGFHPELPTLLFCYFYGLDYNNDLIKSSLQSQVNRNFRAMMGQLYAGFEGGYGGPFKANRVSPTEEYLYWIDAFPWGSGDFYDTAFWGKDKNHFTPAGELLQEYLKDEGNPLGNAWSSLSRKFDADNKNLIRPQIKNVEDSRPLGKILADNWHRFRAFIHYFAKFLAEQDMPKDKRKLLDDTLSRLVRSKMPPGMRPFRDYHVVFDKRDIVDNQISATMAEMANTIIVRAPNKNLKTDEITESEGGNEVTVISHDQGWVYFPDRWGIPFSDRLNAGQRKLYVAEEPNANTKWSQANCLVSNMADALRPMYRGYLKIVGRHVNPWDVVTIVDSYTNMNGPIEVDRVTHEFTRETGWITTLEPHALIHCNSVSAKYTSSMWQEMVSWVLDDGLDIWQWGGIALAIMTGGVGGIALAGLRAGGKALFKKGITAAVMRTVRTSSRFALRNSTRKMWWASATQVGRAVVRAGYIQLFQSTAAPVANALFNVHIKMRSRQAYWPVDFQPLFFKGNPYTAGVEPSEEDVIGFGEQGRGFWRALVKSGREFFTGDPSKLPSGEIPGIGIR